MKNFVQEGKTIDVVVGATITAGQGYMFQGLFGVALSSGVSGDTIPFFVGPGVVELTKDTTGAFNPAQGDQAFWDNTDKRVEATGSGLFPIGVYANEPVAADTKAKIIIAPLFRTAVP